MRETLPAILNNIIVKILKPDWARGSLLLTYKGSNLEYKNKFLLSIIDLQRNRFLEDRKHPITAIIKLFDGVKIVISFTTSEVYQNENINCIENSRFDLEKILINSHIIIIKGKIEYCKNAANENMEYYDFEFITKSKEEIKLEFQKANLKFEIFQ